MCSSCCLFSEQDIRSRGGGGRHNMHSVPCMALASVQKQQHQSNVRMLRHARSISSSGFTSRLDQNKALSFSSFSSSSPSFSTSSRKSSVLDRQEQEQSNMKSYKLQGRTTKDAEVDASASENQSTINKSSKTCSSNSSSRRRSGHCGVTVFTNTGHVLQTDLPKRMGGQDTAPQPVEMLLAAWMGCTQATALFVGRLLLKNHPAGGGVSIDCIEFDNITAFRDERGALALPIDQNPSVISRLQRVTGTITVHALCQQQQQDREGKHGNSNNNNNKSNTSNVMLGISKEQLLVLKEQTELRCPVANMMIASGCVMDVEWVIGSSSTSSNTIKDDV
jgi:uncharacterized OsmC-like protein